MAEPGSIFDFADYRTALQARLGREGKTRGYRANMARAAGCQPAYLSQVFSGASQLTPEQASGICDFWNLDELEAEYFLTLVHLARSGSPRFAEKLRARLERLREQQEARKVRGLEAQPYRREKAVQYYLDWMVSAVHLLLGVPGHASAARIAERLCTPQASVAQALQTLRELGLAEHRGGAWRRTSRQLHASDESMYAGLHHRNWRSRATERLRAAPGNGEVRYTAVHSLSRDDLEGIRRILVDAIERTRSQVAASADETLACLTVDWFEL